MLLLLRIVRKPHKTMHNVDSHLVVLIPVSVLSQLCTFPHSVGFLIVFVFNGTFLEISAILQETLVPRGSLVAHEDKIVDQRFDATSGVVATCLQRLGRRCRRRG